jgi:hypothetical protein
MNSLIFDATFTKNELNSVAIKDLSVIKRPFTLSF